MGNGFKVWHYSGALLHETAWPAGQELNQVIWQKYEENVFKEKPISNVKVQGIEPSQPQSSATKYVPIHLRGGAAPVPSGSSPRSASNYQPERGPIPGLPVGYKVSQGQRKKERNTKRKDSENASKPGANANTSTNSNASDDSGGKPARAQGAPPSTQPNNKQRNNQRRPSNNQNHSIGNGANANNPNQNNGNDSNAKANPNTDPNVSGSATNEHSNTDSDDARKAKRDGRQRNRQRKSESGGSGTSGDPEKDKRIRSVQQKLKDISKLKVRQGNGETLEANQLSKIKMEAELVKELAALKVES